MVVEMELVKEGLERGRVGEFKTSKNKENEGVKEYRGVSELRPSW